MVRTGACEGPEFFAECVRFFCARCVRFHTSPYTGPVQRWRAPVCLGLQMPKF